MHTQKERERERKGEHNLKTQDAGLLEKGNLNFHQEHVEARKEDSVQGINAKNKGKTKNSKAPWAKRTGDLALMLPSSYPYTASCWLDVAAVSVCQFRHRTC